MHCHWSNNVEFKGIPPHRPILHEYKRPIMRPSILLQSNIRLRNELQLWERDCCVIILEWITEFAEMRRGAFILDVFSSSIELKNYDVINSIDVTKVTVETGVNGITDRNLLFVRPSIPQTT